MVTMNCCMKKIYVRILKKKKKKQLINDLNDNLAGNYSFKCGIFIVDSVDDGYSWYNDSYRVISSHSSSSLESR